MNVYLPAFTTTASLMRVSTDVEPPVAVLDLGVALGDQRRHAARSPRTGGARAVAAAQSPNGGSTINVLGETVCGRHGTEHGDGSVETAVMSSRSGVHVAGRRRRRSSARRCGRHRATTRSAHPSPAHGRGGTSTSRLARDRGDERLGDRRAAAGATTTARAGVRPRAAIHRSTDASRAYVGCRPASAPRPGRPYWRPGRPVANPTEAVAAGRARARCSASASRRPKAIAAGDSATLYAHWSQPEVITSATSAASRRHRLRIRNSADLPMPSVPVTQH